MLADTSRNGAGRKAGCATYRVTNNKVMNATKSRIKKEKKGGKQILSTTS